MRNFIRGCVIVVILASTVLLLASVHAIMWRYLSEKPDLMLLGMASFFVVVAIISGTMIYRVIRDDEDI